MNDLIMKQSWIPFFRRKQWFVVALLCVSACGCIGNREARLATNTMIRTSQNATEVVNKLKDASVAEVQADQETRKTVTTLYHSWYHNRQSLLLARTYGEFLRVSNAISASLAQRQLALVNDRISAGANLAAQVDALVKSLQDRVDELDKKAKDAGAAAASATGDLKFLKESAQADRTYVATLGQKIQIQRNAFRDCNLALDAALKDGLDQLASVAAGHQQKIRDLYNQQVQTVQSNSAPPLDLGPEPIANTNAFHDLADYTQAMQHSGEALQEYFVFNSFGKGSFFDTILQGLQQGFIKALPIVGSGKGVTWSEAGDAGTALLKDVETEMKGNFKDAEATATAALNTAANNLSGSLTAKVQDTLNKSIPTITPANVPVGK